MPLSLSALRSFFCAWTPRARRVLVVESGSRHLIEGFLRVLPEIAQPGAGVDVATCFDGAPLNLPDSARIYRVTDYSGSAGRRKLIRELASNRYELLVMLCSNEPVMTRWKWFLAASLPAKTLLVNENGDFVWFDYANARTLLRFLLVRVGLSGSEAVPTLLRLALFPLTLLYLLGFAARVHLLRRLRA